MSFKDSVCFAAVAVVLLVLPVCVAIGALNVITK